MSPRNSFRTGAATVAVAIISLSACWAGSDSAASGDEILPDQLHGLPQVATESGEAATAMIASLHSASVAPTESHIGVYGTEGLRTILYVSRFQSDTEADSQLVLMAEKIGTGTPGFGHFSTFEAEGTQVSQAFGNGQVHYFYVDGTDLKWLAAPAALARPMVAEIMGVKLEAIPPLVSEEAAGERPM